LFFALGLWLVVIPMSYIIVVLNWAKVGRKYDWNGSKK
jgi:hypothetical protein